MVSPFIMKGTYSYFEEQICYSNHKFTNVSKSNACKKRKDCHRIRERILSEVSVENIENRLVTKHGEGGAREHLVRD